MPAKIYFMKGDITEMSVDAIVNAANTDLTMGAGLAAAIRAKGGPRIEEECDRLGSIRLGEATVTTGGSLKAFYVVHAASLRPGEPATQESIHLAVHNSLLRAEEKGLKSLAFPALGAGVGGVSLEDCARVMIKVLLEHIHVRTSLEKIYFVLFDDPALKAFEDAYQKLTARPAVGGDARK